MRPDDTKSGAPVPAHAAPGGAPPTAAEHAEYARRLIAMRAEKDSFLARSVNSPLPPDLRRTFAGLAYFPPEPSYRVAGLRIEPDDGDPRVFALDTSDGRQRAAVRVGRLRFVLAGRALTLTGYRLTDVRSNSLFVPFRDATSGRETYSAGRYLDLMPEPDDTCVLDFNEAYNPFCAYSSTYSCPLPPAENTLEVPIEAGERLMPGPPARPAEDGA